MKKIKISEERLLYINSIIIAFIIFLGMFSFICNINNVIPIFTLIACFIIGIINWKKNNINYEKKRIKILYVIILTIYIILNIALLYCQMYTLKRIIYFLLVCLPTILIFSNKFNMKIVIKSILIFYAIASFYFIFNNFSKYDASQRMSISYYMLPLYITIIFDFYINKSINKKNLIKKVLLYLLIFLPYLIYLVKYISRGVILAILICLLLLYIYKKNIKAKIAIITILIIVIAIIAHFSIPILKSINYILEENNLRVEIVQKSLKLLEEGKFDNGRNKIYTNSIQGIIEKPIFGSGIGSFTKIYNTYEHNVILQLFYEGGIIFGLLIGGNIFLGIYFILFDKKIEEKDKNILIYLFSIALVKLMLSHEFWFEPLFWVYIFKTVDLLNNKIIEKGKKDDKCYNTNI